MDPPLPPSGALAQPTFSTTRAQLATDATAASANQKPAVFMAAPGIMAAPASWLRPASWLHQLAHLGGVAAVRVGGEIRGQRRRGFWVAQQPQTGGAPEGGVVGILGSDRRAGDLRVQRGRQPALAAHARQV